MAADPIALAQGIIMAVALYGGLWLLVDIWRGDTDWMG